MLATLPTGFMEVTVADGVSSGTAMEFAPNGDLWVVEQTGAVKRYRPSSTTADVVGNVSTLGLSSSGERGLLGLAFDPQYATNKQVYLYYTATAPTTHNRISRFSVNDTDATDYFFTGASTVPADAGSSGTPTQQILFDLDSLSGATNHNGGAIHFGPDGKLYVAVGDNANGNNAQSLNTVHGKMLRLNSDGTIPTDNPFFGATSGNNRAIWALGLRNPFTFAFQPDTGRMFINDVGQNTTEEVNDGLPGANYGWPLVEGNQGTPPTSPGTYQAPLYTYSHGSGPLQGFAITGGAFYNPIVQQFPREYLGKYFYADFVNSWINVLDATTGTATPFATNAAGTLDLRVGSDGGLYYLARNSGKVFRVTATPYWSGYANDPQHSAISSRASQPLEGISWQTPVDLAPQFSGTSLLIHYGSPVVTAANTVIVPVKTGANGGFQVAGIDGETGMVKWTQTTDYLLPPHNWTPSYSPTLAPSNRLYFAGAGGTIYYIDSPDAPGLNTVGQIAFYGLANYQANKATYDASVFISTPITTDRVGNIYFGFQVTGANQSNLQSGIARISADGVGTWISAADASGDAGITNVAMNAALALSNDGQKVYVAVSRGNFTSGYLLALNSTTLQRIGTNGQQVRLLDPNGSDGLLSDNGSASPTVGPDGDVYFGVLENPLGSNHYRGWLLHFSSDLSQTKTPGSFGWDDTASIVPASMVPSYSGTSPYLLMVKYNNYVQGGGDGVNELAILDPHATMTYTIGTQNVTTMKEVLTIAGVTPDPDFGGNAVREWCINTAAVDPATGSVLVNSEDGKLYRWDLRTNSFTEQVTLTAGIGEAYTPTIIGADGTVYAINNATLFAVGKSTNKAPIANNLAITLVEESSSGITLSGTDPETSPLTFTVISGPAQGSISGQAPNLIYTPSPHYFGTDVITYQAKDGQRTSALATVSITVNPVNDAPSFLSGPDQQATDESGTLQIPAWATAISPGPANETSQKLHFVIVTNSNPGLFATAPSVHANGALTFKPTPNNSGVATLTIAIQDDGGTANDGVDRSPAQSFQIEITKPHLWHNAANSFDVNDNSKVAADDALAIINYINASGSGPLQSRALISPPYFDVVADNYLAPIDVLAVINFINAAPDAEGEMGPTLAATPTMHRTTTISDSLLALLAADHATQPKRRK